MAGEGFVQGPTIRSTLTGVAASSFAIDVFAVPALGPRVTRVEIEDLSWDIVELADDGDPWKDWTLGSTNVVHLTIHAEILDADAPVTPARDWWEDFHAGLNAESTVVVDVVDPVGDDLQYAFTRCVPAAWSALEYAALEIVTVACPEVAPITPVDTFTMWLSDQQQGDLTPHDVTIAHVGTKGELRRFDHPDASIEAYEFPVLDVGSDVDLTHGLRIRAQQQQVS